MIKSIVLTTKVLSNVLTTVYNKTTAKKVVSLLETMESQKWPHGYTVVGKTEYYVTKSGEEVTVTAKKI